MMMILKWIQLFNKKVSSILISKKSINQNHQFFPVTEWTEEDEDGVVKHIQQTTVKSQQSGKMIQEMILDEFFFVPCNNYNFLKKFLLANIFFHFHSLSFACKPNQFPFISFHWCVLLFLNTDSQLLLIKRTRTRR